MLDPIHDWPCLKALVKVESEIIKKNKTTTQSRYFLSSRNGTAEEFNKAVRGHWGIENSQHWVLDVQFEEDYCRKRKENAAENFAILRRLALNLLKHDKTLRLSIRRKRLRATLKEEYLLQILSYLIN